MRQLCWNVKAMIAKPAIIATMALEVSMASVFNGFHGLNGFNDFIDFNIILMGVKALMAVFDLC